MAEIEAEISAETEQWTPVKEDKRHLDLDDSVPSLNAVSRDKKIG